MNIVARTSGVGGMLVAITLIAGCEHPPVDSVQHGYRGTAMVEVYNPRQLQGMSRANEVPAALAAASDDGPRAREVFKNLQVLGDVSVGELTRTMTAMTSWWPRPRDATIVTLRARICRPTRCTRRSSRGACCR